MSNEISIKRATMLNALAKYTSVILQLIYNGILGRILTPEEFGIVAVINVFIVFFTLFTDMGLGTGVIQNKELTDDDTDNIYSFSIVCGVFLCALFMAISPAIATIYNNRIYTVLGIELAFSLLFNAFNMVPNAIMLKHKRFFEIAVRTVVVNICSFVLTIFFAKRGYGVYALAANSVLSSLGLFIWNEIAVKLHFRVRFGLHSVRKIWNYSLFQFAAQLLNYFNRNLDNLLIGRFFSEAELGQYNKAYSLTQYPINYLPGVVTPVLHPILSEKVDKKEEIYDIYIKVIKILSLLGCFISPFFFFAGKEIILLMFGPQWDAAIFPFQILSLSLWFQMITNTVAPVYQSVGNTKLMFKSSMVTTFIIVLAIFLGFVGGNINAMAISVSVAYMCNFIITYFILQRYIFEASFLKFATNFWHESVIYISILTVALCWNFKIESLIVSFLAKGVVCGIIYVLEILIFKEHRVIMKVKKDN